MDLFIKLQTLLCAYSARWMIPLQVESPILGVVEAGKGRIAVYGDSNCLDSSHMVSNCYWLLKKLLDFTSGDIQDPVIFPATNELSSPLGSVDTILPMRRDDVNFSLYSAVLGHPLQCGTDSPLGVQGSKGYIHEQIDLSSSASQKKTNLQPNSVGGSLPKRQVDSSLLFTSSSTSGSLEANNSTMVKPTSLLMSKVKSPDLPTLAKEGVADQEKLESLERGGVERSDTYIEDSFNEGGITNTTKRRSKNSSQLPLSWMNRDEVYMVCSSVSFFERSWIS